MSATLLHSGKTEHFRALGETGQPVYHSALQLRQVIARRLPGKERHLAIPQRDQQGEGVDWYSDISGDVIPWNSGTDKEREDARIQLEAFRQDVLALQQSAQESPGGDHEVFTRLVKWVGHFPDESFVYLVDGTPVITFWGFIHPEADRHANPLLCLYPRTAPEPAPLTPPSPSMASPAPAPEPHSVPAEPTRPWWKRWWWLLPLLLALLILLFSLRACTTPGAPTLATPSLNSAMPDASFPESLWQGWDVWPFNRWGSSPTAPALTAPSPASPAPGGSPAIPAVDSRPSGMPPQPSAAPVMPDNPAPNAAPQTLPDPGAALPGDMPHPPALTDGAMPPVTPSGDAAAPAPETPDGAPSLEALSLPADAADGPASFLDGNWRGAGVMDSQTGRPLQVTYAFDQGEGAMYIQRGGNAGMTCAGPVSATMQDGQLQVEARERARCEDGSHYEMPSVQCHQTDGGTASCGAHYDDEPFPMQLLKAS